MDATHSKNIDSVLYCHIFMSDRDERENSAQVRRTVQYVLAKHVVVCG